MGTTVEAEPTALERIAQLTTALERVTWSRPTDEADAIRAAMPTDPIRPRGGVTFGPGKHTDRLSVYVALKTDAEGTVRYVTLTVYGAMAYKDRADEAARVELRTALVDGVWLMWEGWTHATAWNGSKYADLPDGARSAVAAAVAAIVQSVHVDIPTLIAEQRFAERSAHRDRCIGEALQALESAVRA